MCKPFVVLILLHSEKLYLHCKPSVICFGNTNHAKKAHMNLDACLLHAVLFSLMCSNLNLVMIFSVLVLYLLVSSEHRNNNSQYYK